MNQAINRLRLFLCFFSGEDDFIIRKCNAKIQIAFAAIGTFVIFIFIACWFSASLFTSHIFNDQRWVSIPIGIFWALLITNLYLLLLYTISPAMLPVAKKKKIRESGKIKKAISNQKTTTVSSFRNLSLLLRIGTLIFLAIIIAQPLNVMFFGHSYKESDLFAATLQGIVQQNHYSWLVTALVCFAFVLPAYLKFQVRTISKNSFKEDFEGKESMKGIRHLREELSNPSDFKNLSQQILSININLIRTSDFYFQKSLIEHRIILEEYEKFNIQYCSTPKKKDREYNINCWRNLKPYLEKIKQFDPDQYRYWHDMISYDMNESSFERFEYWEDPPFRTSHKASNRRFLSEADLINVFYNTAL